MSWESYINYTLCELSNISKKLTPRWDLFGESSYSNLIWESPWRVVFAPSGTNRWQEILGAPSYWKIFTFLGFTMVRFYQFILNIVFLCPQLQHWPFLDVFFLPCETPRHCFGGGVLWQRSLPRISSTINSWDSIYFCRWFVMVFMESFEQPKHFVAGFFGSNDMGFWCWFFSKGCSLLIIVIRLGSLRVLFPQKWRRMFVVFELEDHGVFSGNIAWVRGVFASDLWLCWDVWMQLELHRNSTNSACPTGLKWELLSPPTITGSVEDGCL